MKRKILEPSDYKRLENAWTIGALIVFFCMFIALVAVLAGIFYPCTRPPWYAATLLGFLCVVVALVIYAACFYIFEWIFEVARPEWYMDGVGYETAGEARYFMKSAVRSGGGIRFLTRRVADVDMSHVAAEGKFSFLQGQIAKGGCCIPCGNSEEAANVLRHAGARHLGGGVFELGKAADMQYIYKNLLYEGVWVLLCGVTIDFPRVPQVWGYPDHPEAMDIIRIINRASLVISSGPDDADWRLCWGDDGTGANARRGNAVVLKKSQPVPESVHYFLTKAVGAENVAAVHEVSGKNKDWVVYGVASRDWTQLARRAEKSGEVLFSLRAPAGQVLQAWREMGYRDGAECEHHFSGNAGFPGMLDAIMPEGGCVVSCSHDAEYVYVWAHGV